MLTKLFSATLALLAFFIGTGLLLLNLQSSLTTAAPSLQQKQQVAFYQKLHYRQYSATGHLINQLTAEQMKSFHQGTSTFQHPIIEIIQPTGRHWRIQAQQGLFNQHLNQTFLTGNVRIRTPHATLQHQLMINTSSLHYNNSSQTAKTNAPATIIREHTVTTAKGLIAHLKTGEFEILNHSKTIYTPSVPHNK